MPQQKPTKKAPTRVVKPTRPAAARSNASAVSKAKQTKAAKPVTKTTATTSTRKPGVRVGSGSKNKSNNILASLFTGTRKWVTLAVFVVVFGGIGAYFVTRSHALHDMNDFGCTTTPTIRKGSTNRACVAKIQDTLKYAWGHNLGNTGPNKDGVDGVFGAGTKREVIRFQTNHCKYGGHCPTNGAQGYDGVVGSWTWKHLMETSKYRTTWRIDTTKKKTTSTKGINLAREASWNIIAKCESGLNWKINTGNGYYGGLQFNLSTWRSVNGTDFAAYPHQATREEQITVANRLYDSGRKFTPWPVCGKKV